MIEANYIGKRWLGKIPQNCDICGGKFGEVFYDCLIPGVDHWAKVCHHCFTTYNCKLGTGYGQKYSTKTLEKVDG